MYITVKQPGARTTIQDKGRYGHLGQGIPASGVMDPLAMRIANILVGNDEDHPVIECIGIGPVLEFSDAVYFAICGGTFNVTLNNEPIRINTLYRSQAGDILTSQKLRQTFLIMPVAAQLAKFADDKAAHKSLAGLHKDIGNPVIAYHRIGQRQNLAAIAGVRQALLIPRHAGVEHHFAGRPAVI